MLSYPTEFPTDAARIIVNQIRTHNIEKQLFAEAVWNMVGYGCHRAFGEPQEGNRLMSARPLNDEEVATYLAENNEGRVQAIHLPIDAIVAWGIKKLLTLH